MNDDNHALRFRDEIDKHEIFNHRDTIGIRQIAEFRIVSVASYAAIRELCDLLKATIKCTPHRAPSSCGQSLTMPL